ncbi:hypothetical protein [Bacillus sp. NPDC094106]|uniref:hypothetical protein n=1 Tax=Bacillus sp. NPDC094106 TaxID=3363949 RepID=UPI00382ABC82
MGQMVKKKNHFDIRYKRYLRNSIEYNTKRNILSAKKKDEKYDKSILTHLPTFENMNQTMIGSQLFNLLYQARHDSQKYMKNRIETLKDIYAYVVDNKAWYDLWKTVSIMENGVQEKSNVVDFQVATEMCDMIRLMLPNSKWIVGLKDKQTPLIQELPFYINEKVLTFIESEKTVGRKKGRELYKIQVMSVDLFNYYTRSFGVYNKDVLDLLPIRGINYSLVPSISLPRNIANCDELIHFIFNNRKYTMNPNGVVIDCHNCGDIEQIIFVEKENYLLWKVRFSTKGYRMNHKGDLIEDSTGSDFCGYFSPDLFPRSTFSEYTDYIDFEFNVYTFLLECYADIVCGSNELNKRFDRDVVNMGIMSMLENENSVIKKQVGIRFIPRKIHNRIKDASKTTVEYEKEVQKYFVAGHLRKLPEGHSPSKEALEHAQEFGIELSEGYTFVRPYESGEEKIRTHYVKTL